MLKKWFLVCVTLLLISSLVTGCGISQSEYDTVVAERDEAKAELPSLQSELENMESKIELVKDEAEALQNDLAGAESQIRLLQSDLAEVKELLDLMEETFGKLLFFEDFEDGDTEGWQLTDGWSVIKQDDNYFLEGLVEEFAHIHASIPISYDRDWTDYTLEFRINIIREGFMGNFRNALSNRYCLSIGLSSLTLIKFQPPSSGRMLAQEDLDYRLSGWNDIKVEVYGDNVKAYVNGDLKINYTDHEPLERGGINFEFMEYSHMYLDNIIVTTTK